ncbi:nuclear transport factor 2 family protein [Muricoccus aerilatus]|uniref:nuclear transport factor 2 family protein n=1 Tax=Muricoccus aerilatus TaxID=452982 RepID=UPI0005C1F9B9|nr:nuclear transport factor 2 family protein [Roseomonas aerilata]
MAEGAATGGVEEAARAVLGRFLAAFTAADPAAIRALFWPDALVWGTAMPELATEPEAVRRYFAPLGRRGPGERRAAWRSGTVLAASESVALVSGQWEVGPDSGGGVEILPLRLSIVVTRRDGDWRILQFHSSPLPG